MPADKPIAHTADGRPLFDNTPTVVSVIVTDEMGKVIAMRRAHNPGKGLLCLPGGFHMRGESWQEAGAREVMEEIGLILAPEKIGPLSVNTDEYGHNLIVALYRDPVRSHASPQDGEALEVVRIGMSEINDPGFEWAFPRHRAAVSLHLGEVYKRLRGLERSSEQKLH
ncbi:NUDIX domain-containing protein [Rhodobacteraceae bacterium R_SAG4]|nr:NUDIX domain-containing protein [Rhodobacteraceae bacterium R_SAG4]